MTKTRADIFLVEHGLFESRERAKEAIAAGLVKADGIVVRKPAEELGPQAKIEAGQSHPWVSRGGLKLVAALDQFGIDPTGKTCLDIGASTGGFTQVLLSRGAAFVYAIDVGHGQLHASLHDDPRIRSLEGTDARKLDDSMIDTSPDIITCDTSFISLKLVLPPVLRFAAPNAELVALMKPQFEAGRGQTKKGIVRDAAVHAALVEDFAGFIGELGWQLISIIPSPIAGGDGNREFLIGARRPVSVSMDKPA